MATNINGFDGIVQRMREGGYAISDEQANAARPKMQNADYRKRMYDKTKQLFSSFDEFEGIYNSGSDSEQKAKATEATAPEMQTNTQGVATMAQPTEGEAAEAPVLQATGDAAYAQAISNPLSQIKGSKMAVGSDVKTPSFSEALKSGELHNQKNFAIDNEGKPVFNEQGYKLNKYLEKFNNTNANIEKEVNANEDRLDQGLRTPQLTENASKKAVQNVDEAIATRKRTIDLINQRAETFAQTNSYLRAKQALEDSKAYQGGNALQQQMYQLGAGMRSLPIATYDNYQEAVAELQKPKTGDTWYKAFSQGVADVAKDSDTYLMGLISMGKTIQAQPVIEKLANDQQLTADEAAFIDSLMTKAAAQLMRADDVSNWYKGGNIAAESAAFMLQFFMSAGLGEATTKGLTKGFIKYLKGRVTQGLSTGAKKKALAESGEFIEGLVKSKAVQGTLDATVGSVARAAIHPSTYTNTVNMMGSNVDMQGNVLDGNSFLQSLGSSILEVSSESVEWMPGVGKKGLWRCLEQAMPNAGKMSKRGWMTEVGKVLNANNRFLERTGIHPLSGEIFGELANTYGNYLIGVQTEQDLKDFFSPDNFGTMLIGFMPGTILGIRANTISYAQVRTQTTAARKNLTDVLGKTGMSQEQIAQWIGNLDNASMDDMQSIVEDVMGRCDKFTDKREICKALAAYESYKAVQNTVFDSEDTKEETNKQIDNLNDQLDKVSVTQSQYARMTDNDGRLREFADKWIEEHGFDNIEDASAALSKQDKSGESLRKDLEKAKSLEKLRLKTRDTFLENANQDNLRVQIVATEDAPAVYVTRGDINAENSEIEVRDAEGKTSTISTSKIRNVIVDGTIEDVTESSISRAKATADVVEEFKPKSYVTMVNAEGDGLGEVMQIEAIDNKNNTVTINTSNGPVVVTTTDFQNQFKQTFSAGDVVMADARGTWKIEGFDTEGNVMLINENGDKQVKTQQQIIDTRNSLAEQGVDVAPLQSEMPKASYYDLAKDALIDDSQRREELKVNLPQVGETFTADGQTFEVNSIEDGVYNITDENGRMATFTADEMADFIGLSQDIEASKTQEQTEEKKTFNPSDEKAHEDLLGRLKTPENANKFIDANIEKLNGSRRTASELADASDMDAFEAHLREQEEVDAHNKNINEQIKAWNGLRERVNAPKAEQKTEQKAEQKVDTKKAEARKKDLEKLNSIAQKNAEQIKNTESVMNLDEKLSAAKQEEEQSKQREQRRKNLEPITDALHKKFGTKYNFVDDLTTSNGKQANGEYDQSTNTVTINLASPEAMNFILGHEMSHNLKALGKAMNGKNSSATTDAWNKVKDIISKRMPNFEQAVKSRIKLYKNAGQNLTYNDAVEEVVSDYMGEMLKDGEFYNELQKDPTLWQQVQKVIDAILDTLEDLVGYTSNDRLYRDIKRVYDKAAKEYGNLTDKQRKEVRARITKMVEKEGLSKEIAEELANNNLTVDGGVVMSTEAQKLKEQTGYETPIEKKMSYGTRLDWAEHYLGKKPTEREKQIARVVDSFYERAAADDAIHDYMNYSKYPSGVNKDGKGPLRKNVEYVYTFDMDTTCPRTFQYLNYANSIERQIKRPLSSKEAVQLIEEMRAMGQMIPCVYCYAENKRQALKNYFLNFMEARKSVISASTEEEAEKAMYGHDENGNLSPAARKVLARWRNKEGLSTYNPSMKLLYMHYTQARNIVFTELDNMHKSNLISSRTSEDKIVNMLAKKFGIDSSDANMKNALYAVGNLTNEWHYDLLEGKSHKDFEEMSNMAEQNKNALALWGEMVKYGNSASGAHNSVKYFPYTSELSGISKNDKDYINGMGGLRMHSSNDFRIDYVGDYLQLIADMAKYGWKGHTYTKNPDFVRIFGRTGYKINMSIAAYTDENGNVIMNQEEGHNWDEVKELRKNYPNAGTMFMTTDAAQLQYALDSDWIDMIIPFHSSGLPKEVWYDMRKWDDVQSVQNERLYNSADKKAILKERGIAIPKGAKTADIDNLFDENIGTKKVFKKDGKQFAPHFLPGETIVDGVVIPGHNNDINRYLDLCKEYGVKPRFAGMKVKDKNGNEIDITEHPGYIKLIKETSRTETEQTPIQFNLDEVDDNLGMTPIEYAFSKLREFADQGGYSNLEEDQYGIVPSFIKNVINYEKETGKQRPLNYISDDARMMWQHIKRGAEAAAMSDEEIRNAYVPYHPVKNDNNKYSISADSQQMRDAIVRYSIRNSKDSRVIKKVGEQMSVPEHSFSSEEVKQFVEANNVYNEELKKFRRGELNDSDILHLGNTGSLLQRLGFPKLPIEMKGKVIGYKASEDYDSNHPFENSEIGDMVFAINSPIMVFNSKTHPLTSKVLLLDIKHNGINFVASVHMSYEKEHNTIKVNDITSLFPKDKTEGIKSWIRQGDLLQFTNKEKSLEWLTRQQSNSVETESIQDFDYAKVINEFDNNVHLTNSFTNNSAIQNDSNQDKQSQLDIIQKNNPMRDDVHLGIRSVDDIKTFAEAYEEGDRGYNDNKDNVEKAMKTGKVTIYSSRPIGQGSFVSTSKMMAGDYAGGKGSTIYSREVPTSAVAWINLDEGQYADVDNKSYKDKTLVDDGVRYSITPEMDADYMKAVSTKDNTTAQKMVDDAAKANGYIKKATHNTNEVFTVFDKNRLSDNTQREDAKVGFHFLDENFKLSDDNKTQFGGKQMDVYLKMGKSLDASKYERDVKDIIDNYYNEHQDELDFVESGEELYDYLKYDENAEEYGGLKGFLANQCNVFDNYDSMVADFGKGEVEYIVPDANQIKSADAITYDNNGNVIPLSKRFDKKKSDIRYSITNDTPVFISNANKAVTDIKQDKATAEQWLAMLTKNGGLKAEEDKWLGLSDYLKNRTGSVTKQEILDYIAANDFKIEEVEYEKGVDERTLDNFYDTYSDNVEEIIDEKLEEKKEEYEEEHPEPNKNDYEDDWEYHNAIEIWRHNLDEILFEYKHEVLEESRDEAFDKALESYPELNGYHIYIEGGNAYADSDVTNLINSIRLDYTTKGLDNKREIALTIPTIDPYNESDEIHFGDAGKGRAVAWCRFGETTDSEGNKVLVIDEVQSKRHQDAREKVGEDEEGKPVRRGYQNSELTEAKKEAKRLKAKYDKYTSTLEAKYGEEFTLKCTDEESAKADELYDTYNEQEQKVVNIVRNIEDNNFNAVPDAPFQTTWHELVMKRMLRFAADNDFDKVAWTKGAQQTERYGMDDGHGMVGFYDQMLPKYMDKYCKKWGTKTHEVNLPELEESAQTMWAVDVTDSMKESVQQGQPRFSISPDNNLARPTNKTAYETLRDAMAGYIEERAKIASKEGRTDLNENNIKYYIDSMLDAEDKTSELASHARQALRDCLLRVKDTPENNIEVITSLAQALIAKKPDALTVVLANSVLAKVKKATDLTEAKITDLMGELYDAIAPRQARAAQKMFDKIRSYKVQDRNGANVSVAKNVDDKARLIVTTFNEWLDKDGADVDAKIAELNSQLVANYDNLTDTQKQDLENRQVGLELVKKYNDLVKEAQKNIQSIREEMKNTAKDDQLDKDRKRQTLAALKDMEREAYDDITSAFDEMSKTLGSVIAQGKEDLTTRLKAISERKKQVLHYANSDLKNVKPIGNVKERKWIDGLMNFFGNPTRTMLTELKKFARNAPGGQGYLYDHFARGFVDARHKQITGMNDATDLIDRTVQGIFGNRGSFEKAFADSHKDIGYHLVYNVNPVEGTKDEIDLNVGKAMMIYMWNKQKDGKLKLRNMGITDEVMIDIENALRNVDGGKWIELSDAIQQAILPRLRAKYNETHLELYGTQMKEIENYFPLKIDKSKNNTSDKNGSEDIMTEDFNQYVTSTVGSIKNRSFNKCGLDIMNYDALSLLKSHIVDMEWWNAMAPIATDMNTLLSNGRFKNKIEALSSGSAKRLSQDLARIMIGKYSSKGADYGFITDFMKLAAKSKIAFRFWTATKQLASFPAFTADRDISAIKLTAHMLSNGGVSLQNDWRWAMENLPMLKERWNSRLAGNDKLDTSTFDKNAFGRAYNRFASGGILANGAVDAYTCAVGARLKYEGAKKRYMSYGLSEEDAHKRAIQDAEILYNESQQSSEGLFLSQIQKDKNPVAVVYTAFQNSQMGYTRKFIEGFRQLGKMRTAEQRKQMYDFALKKWQRAGLSDIQADIAAQKDVRANMTEAMSNIATFGYIVGAAWKLMSVLPQLAMAAMGDDDDEKREAKEKAIDAMWGGLDSGFQGFTGGATIESVYTAAYNALAHDADMSKIVDAFEGNQNLMISDLVSEGKKLYNAYSENDYALLGWEISKVALEFGGGLDVTTFHNMMRGAMDMVADLNADGKEISLQEVTLDLSRILNAPNSQLEAIGLNFDIEKKKKYGSAYTNEWFKNYIEWKRKNKYGIFYKMAENEPVTKDEAKKAKKLIKTQVEDKLKRRNEK